MSARHGPWVALLSSHPLADVAKRCERCGCLRRSRMGGGWVYLVDGLWERTAPDCEKKP